MEPAHVSGRLRPETPLKGRQEHWPPYFTEMPRRSIPGNPLAAGVRDSRKLRCRFLVVCLQNKYAVC